MRRPACFSPPYIHPGRRDDLSSHAGGAVNVTVWCVLWTGTWAMLFVVTGSRLLLVAPEISVVSSHYPWVVPSYSGVK